MPSERARSHHQLAHFALLLSCALVAGTAAAAPVTTTATSSVFLSSAAGAMSSTSSTTTAVTTDLKMAVEPTATVDVSAALEQRAAAPGWPWPSGHLHLRVPAQWRHSWTLQQLQVAEGAIIPAAVCCMGSMQIFFKTLTGNTLTLNLRS